MAAEWILQGWSYDPAELAAFVGSNDEKRAKKIARAAKELHDDDRLDGTLEEVILEIVRKKLVRDHGMSYRIALEAIIAELGDKISFDVNPQSKGYKRLTTYGLKERLDEVLKALGQKTLVRAWNRPIVTFPTPALGRATQWPIATSLDPSMLARAAVEAKTLPKRSAIDASARETLKGDEDFAEPTADVVVVLAQLVTKAAKKKRSLMVLVDGEQ
jgi:hypothetical protein